MLEVVIKEKLVEVGTIQEYFTTYPEVRLKNKKTGLFYPSDISFEINPDTNEYKFFAVTFGEKEDITKEVDNSDYELEIIKPYVEMKR